MSADVLLTLTQKELRDALRNRWLWLFAMAFGLLAIGLGGFALASTAGAVGFSRTVAGLINLTLLLVPLLGLTLGAQSLAGERELHTLAYLLAQPISRAELLLGKYLGLGLALGTAVALGFGLAGLVLGASGIDASAYAQLVSLALLLGLASLSLGIAISTLSRRASVAIGVAVVVWFTLVLLADLGLMGTALALRLRADAVFALALVNPLQVFKLAAVMVVRPSLEVLGPAGLYGATRLGVWLGPALVGLLVGWTVAPVVAASLVLHRQEEP